MNKKVALNKVKLVEGKKTNWLTKKIEQILEKGYDFSFGGMYFKNDNGYQKSFDPVSSLLIVDSNEKFIKCILIGEILKN